MTRGLTLTQFLISEKDIRGNGNASLMGLMEGIATAAKIISHEVRRAGLTDILGDQGGVNVHGERVQKLDMFSNEAFIKSLCGLGYLAGIASEEMEEVYQMPDMDPKGEYVLLMDPLDGSSNIDVNVSIGSIFSIRKRKSAGRCVILDGFLQKGTEQVAAGYVLYGPSTILIYTGGAGVYGFTLDSSIGEFVLSHERIQIPKKGKIYSTNEGNASFWGDGIKKYVEGVKKEGMTARYVGSLVADFHRNLLKGGVFLYPADSKNPNGKLRLLYEAAPLAFVIEQAQGSATTGSQPIMDILPQKLHQRTPLVIGSPEDVAQVGACCAGWS